MRDLFNSDKEYKDFQVAMEEEYELRQAEAITRHEFEEAERQDMQRQQEEEEFLRSAQEVLGR